MCWVHFSWLSVLWHRVCGVGDVTGGSVVIHIGKSVSSANIKHQIYILGQPDLVLL